MDSTAQQQDLREPLLPQPADSADPSSTAFATTDCEENSSNNEQDEQDENVEDPIVYNTSLPQEEDDKNITISFCGRRRLSLNHNVFLNLVLSVLYGMSDSLWAGTVFVAYLKRLGRNQNGPVGDIEAVNGLAVLISALPIGYLADRQDVGRDKLIRAGGVLFVVTAVLHAGTMTWIGVDEEALSPHQERISLILLGIIMALWGVGGGIVSGPCQALYADSTPAGERSVYYHYLFVTYLVSSCLGPIVSIFLFQKLGDEWNLYQLRIIIYVGLAMEATNAFVMMWFDDKKALEEEEEGNETEQQQHPEEGHETLAVAESSTNDHLDPITEALEEGQEAQAEKVNPTTHKTGSSMTLSTTATTVEEEDNDTLTQSLLPQQDSEEPEPTTNNGADRETGTISIGHRTITPRQQWIPYILFCSGLIFSIGSGMTVKFFPLFFKDEVKLSPSQVQGIYVIVPIVMSLFSGVGTKLASYLGRVETTMLLQVLGISCLYAMVFFKSYLDAHPFILVPIYILRTSLMNCSYPLVESILMDFVRKDERARWKSLESIGQFGWCGSAALGGYVSDRFDYTHTFFLTATIQVIGTCCYALLLPLVPRDERALTTTTTSNENNTEPSNENAVQPSS